VRRFDYFRQVVRVRDGIEPRENLLNANVQELFDTHFLASAAWEGRQGEAE
jgi:hypothetical protein